MLAAFGGFVLGNLPKNLCPHLILVPPSMALWTLQRELVKLVSPLS